MSTLFLIVCGTAVVFYTVFLIECSQPRRPSRRAPAVHELDASEAVNFAAGRRFLVHLEKQMAEFVPHGTVLSASRQRFKGCNPEHLDSNHQQHS